MGRDTDRIIIEPVKKIPTAKVPKDWDVTKWMEYGHFVTSSADDIIHKQVMAFIAGMRSIIPEGERYYKGGDCYDFHKKLKTFFTQNLTYYNSNHIITEINGRYYDITGVVQKGEDFLEVKEHFGFDHLDESFGKGE